MQAPHSDVKLMGLEPPKSCFSLSFNTLPHAWATGSATCFATVSLLSDATNAEPDVHINNNQAAYLLAGCVDTLKYFSSDVRKPLFARCAAQAQDGAFGRAWSAAVSLARSWPDASYPGSTSKGEQEPMHQEILIPKVQIYLVPLHPLLHHDCDNPACKCVSALQFHHLCNGPVENCICTEHSPGKHVAYCLCVWPAPCYATKSSGSDPRFEMQTSAGLDMEEQKSRHAAEVW